MVVAAATAALQHQKVFACQHLQCDTVHYGWAHLFEDFSVYLHVCFGECMQILWAWRTMYFGASEQFLNFTWSLHYAVYYFCRHHIFWIYSICTVSPIANFKMAKAFRMRKEWQNKRKGFISHRFVFPTPCVFVYARSLFFFSI